jgi:hypothetical protein
MRTRATALAIGIVLTQALGSVTPARAADPVTATFTHTGSEQSWDVPFGVTTIHVVLVGGRGSDIQGGTDPARVEGDLIVTPGARVYVEVGGDGVLGGNTPGAGAGGFNGGGSGGSSTIAGPSSAAGGGGASDIRTLPRTDPGSLASRLMVAGGGGGAGNSQVGGAAGQAAAAPIGGGAGTSTAGGAGGIGDVAGASGAFGSGGAGASGSLGGGGGGGGYYGGGGGAAGTSGGGGGGGSSFTGSASNTSTSLAGSASVPTIAITYEGGEPGSPNGTVDATVTMADSAACLQLSTSAIDFGTRRFGEVRQAASPSIEVANCATTPGLILARGTDATGDGPSFWSLVDTGLCEAGTLGTDNYLILLEDTSTGVGPFLNTANTEIATLASFATEEYTAFLNTPCPGSTGGGVVMGMQILFTAVED